MLSQFKAAQQAGAVSVNVLNFASADDTWQAYLGWPEQVVNVRASRFIAQRAMISGTLAAPLPGYFEGPARSSRAVGHSSCRRVTQLVPLPPPR